MPKKPPAKARKRPTRTQGHKTAPTALGDGLAARKRSLETLLGWLQPVPAEWIVVEETDQSDELAPLPCTTYKQVVTTWRKALKWRQHMDDVLSTMLAVALSTVQQGDQLMLMVIGHAGSGKTRFCDAMLVSKKCMPVEHVTGILSGFKDNEGNDYSLLARGNRKCWITPEGDVLMSNPNAVQVMSQIRRAFDGTTGATYKNEKDDKRYGGLRIPWIMAGTPALLDMDQSRLGDRFLKVYVESPNYDQRKEILRRIVRTAADAVKTEAVGENLVGPKLQEAYQRTGGYVDWLRDNTDKLGKILVEEHHLEDCALLAEFAAFMRARPGKNEESEPTKEEPNRLAHQFVRMMCCLTVVLNRERVDDEVMRRVRKIAMDTSRGPVLDITRAMYKAHPNFMTSRALSIYTDASEDRTRKLLKYLRGVGAVQLNSDTQKYKKASTKAMWGLTDELAALCEEVL